MTNNRPHWTLPLDGSDAGVSSRLCFYCFRLRVSIVTDNVCTEKEILNLTIEKRQVKDEMSEQRFVLKLQYSLKYKCDLNCLHVKPTKLFDKIGRCSPQLAGARISRHRHF